jgi:hypothetical protein
MYISHKSNVIQSYHELEWRCRKTVKGLNRSEYWTWVATVTSDAHPPVIDYSGETGYTIVECTDEDVQARLEQLGDYQAEGVYNITWSDSKVSAVTGQDIDGNDITIQTHFSGNDTAKDARLLAEQWTQIRTERTKLLAETDWTQGNDTPLSDADKAEWTTYRASLRTLPVDQSSKTTYASITWPDKP